MDVEVVVNKYINWDKINPKHSLRRRIKPFSAENPLYFSAMNILRTFLKIAPNKWFLVAIPGCQSKLSQAALTSWTISTHKAGAFLDHYFIPYVISTLFLTANKVQADGNSLPFLQISSSRTFHLYALSSAIQQRSREVQQNQLDCTTTVRRRTSLRQRLDLPAVEHTRPSLKLVGQPASGH